MRRLWILLAAPAALWQCYGLRGHWDCLDTETCPITDAVAAVDGGEADADASENHDAADAVAAPRLANSLWRLTSACAR